MGFNIISPYTDRQPGSQVGESRDSVITQRVQNMIKPDWNPSTLLEKGSGRLCLINRGLYMDCVTHKQMCASVILERSQIVVDCNFVH